MSKPWTGGDRAPIYVRWHVARAKARAGKALTKGVPAAGSKALAARPKDPDPARLYMRVPEGKTEAQAMAAVAMEGIATNAMLANGFSVGVGVGNNDLTHCMESISEIAKRVQGGDLQDCERLLVAQALGLNAIYGELARRAMINMGERPEAMERYFRLAYKAQAQCRTAVETLAQTKNPRHVTFAKQVNQASGPQQVNNGGDQCSPRVESESPPNKLLGVEDAEWVDAGASGTTAASNPEVATVVAIDRATHRGRKVCIRAKRMEGRRADATA